MKTASTYTALHVYVGDGILTGLSITKLKLVKNHLNSTFSIKDLGDLHYLFALEIHRTDSEINLTQRKCDFEIITEVNFPEPI